MKTLALVALLAVATYCPGCIVSGNRVVTAASTPVEAVRKTESQSYAVLRGYLHYHGRYFGPNQVHAWVMDKQGNLHQILINEAEGEPIFIFGNVNLERTTAEFEIVLTVDGSMTHSPEIAEEQAAALVEEFTQRLY